MELAAVNCRGIMKAAAVNCRGVFSSFIGVFQPYSMCEQQFSSSFGETNFMHLNS